MSELSDLLEGVDFGAIDDELKDRAAHLIARINGKLDYEEKRIFAWVMAKLGASSTAVAKDPGDAISFVHGTDEADQSGQAGGESGVPAGAPVTADQPAAAVPVDELSTQSPTTDPASAGVVDGAQGEGTVGDGGDPTPVDSGQPVL
jgi:hypothetical protein